MTGSRPWQAATAGGALATALVSGLAWWPSGQGEPSALEVAGAFAQALDRANYGLACSLLSPARRKQAGGSECATRVAVSDASAAAFTGARPLAGTHVVGGPRRLMRGEVLVRIATPAGIRGTLRLERVSIEGRLRWRVVEVT